MESGPCAPGTVFMQEAVSWKVRFYFRIADVNDKFCLNLKLLEPWSIRQDERIQLSSVLQSGSFTKKWTSITVSPIILKSLYVKTCFFTKLGMKKMNHSST